MELFESDSEWYIEQVIKLCHGGKFYVEVIRHNLKALLLALSCRWKASYECLETTNL